MTWAKIKRPLNYADYLKYFFKKKTIIHQLFTIDILLSRASCSVELTGAMCTHSAPLFRTNWPEVANVQSVSRA